MKQIIIDRVRRLIYRVAPSKMTAFQRYRYLSTEAKKISSQWQIDSSHRDRFDVIQKTSFATQQIAEEFTALMERVKLLEPKQILEIGAFQGGTLSLFSQVAPSDCRILSVDIAYQTQHCLAYKNFTHGKQQITCFSGDSSSQNTLSRVKRWTKSRPLDVLFIDGNHSLKGVSADFDLYSPLVRPGGLIIFHDIVADFTTRYGKPTPSDTGEVPQFWNHLKQKGFRTQEIIANPDQDGFGIGVIEW